MPRKRRSDSPCDSFDEDYDEDTSSTSSRSGEHPPIQRNAANARERARMRVLSSAFCRLKTKLPNIPADTKLSKLDTLRLATIYIQQLKSLVDNDGNEQHHNVQTNNSSLISLQPQQSLTWPFTFQQISNNNYHRQPALVNNNNNINNFSNNNHEWNQQKVSTEIYANHHQNQMMQSIYDDGGHHQFH